MPHWRQAPATYRDMLGKPDVQTRRGTGLAFDADDNTGHSADRTLMLRL